MPSEETSAAAQAQSDTPRLERLKRAFNYATQRVEAGDEVPEMPKELGEWGRNTSVAMFAGICFLGARQVVRHRKLGPYIPQQRGLSKGQETKMIADENSKRLLRTIGEAIKGGVQFGSLAGLFYAVQMISSVANGEKSVGDTIFAAAVAGSVFGAFLPGGGPQRLRSSIVGAALGASAGFPVGFLQMHVESQLKEQAPKSEEFSTPARRYPELQGDATDAVIRQLQSGLRK